MKYDIYNLVIEVGRQCNLACSHCLRGPSQNIKIDTKYIDAILDHTEHISDITLTGGEPFLYPDIIRYITNKIKNNNISLGAFFIATNGLVKNYEVLHDILDLYALSEDKEICELKISRDKYHHNEDAYWDVLDAFKFSNSDINDLDEQYLIKEGFAADNYKNASGRPRDEKPTIEYNNDVCCLTEGLIYLNANGDILTCCDFSYDNQDDSSYGNLNNMSFDAIIKAIEDSDD